MSEQLETLRHQLAVLVDALRDDSDPVSPQRLQTLILLAEAVLTRLKRELIAQDIAAAIPDEEIAHE